MPFFYVSEQHIYYAELLFATKELIPRQVMIGIGYSAVGFKLSLFQKEFALEFKVEDVDAPGFLQFARAYAEKAPLPIIAVLWKRCNAENKFDVLHALDPERIGTLYTLPPRQVDVFREYIPFVKSHLNHEQTKVVTVEQVVRAPSVADAKCVNPFYQASLPEKYSMIALVASTLGFDAGPGFEEQFALSAKFHPTIITLAAAIKKAFYTEDITMTTVSGVTETNLVSRDGAYYLAHNPLAALEIIGHAPIVLAFVFAETNTTIPSPTAIEDSAAMLGTNVNIIEIYIPESKYISEFLLTKYAGNPDKASYPRRNHMAFCDGTTFKWINRKAGADNAPRNGVTLRANGQYAIYNNDDIEEQLEDLNKYINSFREECLLFVKDDDVTKTLRDVVDGMYNIAEDVELSEQQKIYFIDNTLQQGSFEEIPVEDDQSDEESEPLEFDPQEDSQNAISSDEETSSSGEEQGPREALTRHEKELHKKAINEAARAKGGPSSRTRSKSLAADFP